MKLDRTNIGFAFIVLVMIASCWIGFWAYLLVLPGLYLAGPTLMKGMEKYAEEMEERMEMLKAVVDAKMKERIDR